MVKMAPKKKPTVCVKTRGGEVVCGKRTPSIRSLFKTKGGYDKAISEDDGFIDFLGIENDELTPKGLIAKMRTWDEEEHGVEAYIYDMTARELKGHGLSMPKDIRRVK